MGLAGVIVTFRDRLDGCVLAGEEGTMRLGRADETVLGLVPIGAAIDDLDVILPPDDFDLAGVAGFEELLRPGVITTLLRETPLLADRLADVLLMGVMTLERRVLVTVGRLLDLLTVGRLTDELLLALRVLELLFFIGVMTVLRCEVDERVPLRLATSTVRLVGREKDGRGVETLGAGLDLTVLGGEDGRGGETLGLGLGEGITAGRRVDLLGDLDGALGAGRDTRAGADLALGAGRDTRAGADLALGAGRDTRAGADLALGAGRDTRAGADLAGAGRDLVADFGADFLTDDDLAEDLDDLPLCGAALPNAGPKVIIAVNSTANSVFSTCLVNISRSLSSILVIYNGYNDYYLSN